MTVDYLLKLGNRALKLHPMRTELWIYAARHAMDENGDITEARSFMQRGLRFNKGSKQLWLEYTKLELVYIAKVITRRRLLGIDGAAQAAQPKDKDEDENMLELPTIVVEEMNPEVKEGEIPDDSPLNNLENNAALNGAIPLAVFDTAIKEIPNDIDFVFSFFNLFAIFPNLPCLARLLEHVINHALEKYPTSPLALFMDIKEPIIGVDSSSPAFPSKIGIMLSKISDSIGKAVLPIKLYQLITSSLSEILHIHDLDPAIGTVIRGALIKHFKQAESSGDIDAEMYVAWTKILESSGKSKAAQGVLARGREAFPGAAILSE